MPLDEALGAIDPQNVMDDVIRQRAPDLAGPGVVDPQMMMDRLIRRNIYGPKRERAPATPATQSPPEDLSKFGKDPGPAVDFSAFGRDGEEAPAPEPVKQPDPFSRPSVVPRPGVTTMNARPVETPTGEVKPPESYLGTAAEAGLRAAGNTPLGAAAKLGREAIRGSEFEKGLVGGTIGGHPKNFGDALEGLGHLIGNESLIKRGESMSASGAKTLEGYKARVPSIADVHGVEDFGAYAAHQVGSGIASSAPSVVMGGAASLLTANPLIGLGVGAFGPSYVQNYGDVFGSAKSDKDIAKLVESGKLTKRDIAKASALAAVPMAALDVLGLEGSIGTAAFSKARQDLARRLVKAIAVGSVSEGATEGLQEVISQWAQDYLGSKKPAYDKFIAVVDNVLGGMLTGGVMGGGAAATRAGMGEEERAAGTAGGTTAAPGTAAPGPGPGPTPGVGSAGGPAGPGTAGTGRARSHPGFTTFTGADGETYHRDDFTGFTYRERADGTWQYANDGSAAGGPGAGPGGAGPDFEQKPWEGEPWGGMKFDEDQEKPQPFKSAMNPRMRSKLEETAAYYKEFDDDTLASWSDAKLKEYVNRKNAEASMGTDDDVLRRAGMTDDEIKGMSPEEKTAAAAEARGYGVHAGAEPKREGTREAPIEPETAEDIAAAAGVADPDHTHAQGEANNAQRGHMRWSGLDITIEAAKGGMRRGTAPDGTPFETQVGAHYGYFKGLPAGADGQHPDVFVGDHPNAPTVFVLDELDPDTGKFRQTKSFVGFQTLDQVMQAFLGTSSKAPNQIGGMRAFSADEFKAFAREGGLSKPVAPRAERAGENASAPSAPSAGPEHQQAVADVLRAAGENPAHHDPATLAAAAELHAQGAPPDHAFVVAVAQGLIDDGYITDEIANDIVESRPGAERGVRAAEGGAAAGGKAAPAKEGGRSSGAQAGQEAGKSQPQETAGQAGGGKRPTENAGGAAEGGRAASDAAGGERPAAAGAEKPAGKQGVRVKPERKQSLLQFIASRGGIDPKEPLLSDLRMILGTPNRFVPGYGPLIRKGGKLLDNHREAAVEAGYLHDVGHDTEAQAVTTVANLLDRLDDEIRASKPGHAAYEQHQERMDDLAKAREKLAAALKKIKYPVDQLAPEDMRLASELMLDEDMDPLDAIERAVMRNERLEEDVSRDEVGYLELEDAFDALERPAAHEAGEAPAPQGERDAASAAVTDDEAGEPARGAGESTGGGSEPVAAAEPASERTEAGEQHILPGAERISDAERAKRGADAGLKPKVAQKPADEGLFSDQAGQTDLVDLARKSARAAEMPRNLPISPSTEGMFVEIGTKRYEVGSLKEASEKVRTVTDMIPSSEFRSVLVVDGAGKVIGHVAYNGRVFSGRPEDWKPGVKPIYDNRDQQNEEGGPGKTGASAVSETPSVAADDAGRWWKSDLTPHGREMAAKATGLTPGQAERASKMSWQHISPAIQAKLAAIRGTDQDPVQIRDAPTWAEVLAALPKDDKGRPDLDRAAALMHEISGKKQPSYQDLTPSQKTEMLARLREPQAEKQNAEPVPENRPVAAEHTIQGRPVYDDYARALADLEAGKIKQADDKAGYCYKLAAKAVIAEGGTYVIGLTNTNTQPVYHAVVEWRDTKTYYRDPTLTVDAWFEASVFDKIVGGWRPVHSMFGGEVKRFGMTTGKYPDPVTLKLPSIAKVMATPLPAEAAAPTIKGEESADGLPLPVSPSDEGQSPAIDEAIAAVGATRPALGAENAGSAGDAAQSAPGRSDHGGDEGGRGADAGGPIGLPGQRDESGTGREGRPAVGPAAHVTGVNHLIAPGALDEGRSFRTKALDNVRAIELLRAIEQQARPATQAEQAELARYVGWGGIKGAFPDADGNYGKGFEKIGERVKELLSPEEYKTAQRSIQYAHYTAEEIVRGMWRAVARMGFKGGSAFEPGMGVGNFAGMRPDGMPLNYSGLELDHITAGIAKLLYPGYGIRQGDFTRTPLPADTFDLVIGNPPFADVAIKSDPKYAKHGFLLHDYFFAKSLDAVRPGGLLAFISSAGTMNKLDTAAREYLADRADLVAAIRLPSNAFAKNAGTEVTTDIVFLRKRMPGEAPGDRSWTETAKVTLPDKAGKMVEGEISRYFAEHPEMVLGEQGWFDKLYEGRYAVHARKGEDFSQAFAAAIERLPAEIMGPVEKTFTAAVDWAATEHKDGSFYIGPDGRLHQFTGGAGIPVQRRGAGVEGGKTAGEIERITALIPVRDALRAVYAADLAEDAAAGDKARRDLNKSYDAFVKQFGPINKADLQRRRPTSIQEESARSEAREEARYAGLSFDEGTFDPTDMIAAGATTMAVARARKEAREKAQAAGKRWDEGSFDPDEMPDIIIDRRPNIDPFMDDPESYRLRAIEHYDDPTGKASKSRVFTQNVVSRLKEPEIKSVNDAVLHVLNKHGRLDIPEIGRLLGKTESETIEALGDRIFRDPGADRAWVMRDEYLSGNVRKKLALAKEEARRNPDYQRNVDALEASQPTPLGPAQIHATLGMPWIPEEIVTKFGRDALGLESLVVRYMPALAHWEVHGDTDSAAAATIWGTDRRRAPALISDALNHQTPKIYDTFREAGTTTTVLNVEATTSAQEKLQAIKDKFTSWIWSDPKQTDSLAALYNEHYNNLVDRQYDGAYLSTPGVANHWGWRPHQTRVIARIIQSGNTYMAHAVGAGKTSAMIGAGMEMRRLGLVRKPMYAVPNHMLGQFTKEFYEQYPTARIAVADERRFHTDRRKQFIANVANDDLDAVIITHSAFGMIPISDTFADRVIQDELDEYRKLLAELPNGQDSRITRSRIEKQIERLEQRLAGRGTKRRDQVFTFEEMGVDFLFVDEAHEFRKLDFATAMSGVKGISPEGSAKAWDLYVKTLYLNSKNPGRSLVLASGTPVTNTMAELYTLSRYLQPEQLAERGLSRFDAWAGAFGETKSELEQDAAGGYKSVSRFARFVNVAELSAMVRQAMDVVTSRQLEQYVVRPKLKGGKRIMNMAQKSPALERYQSTLAQRMEKIQSRKGPPKKGDDIMLSVINDGRHAAIDMRLVGAKDDKTSKLSLLVDNVFRIWKESKRQKFYGVKKGENVYDLSKPIDVGPATQMIFANLGISGARGFSVPDFIRGELVRRGVPKSEIAFIYDYKTHVARQKLFNDMNEGKVRILIGSTAKMGTGVNAQRRLIAIHNQDPLWYPSDDEQRNGRGLRQGNQNPEIEIHDYSTKGTYDSTMWGMMARKAKFIQGFFEGDPSLREMDDLGEAGQYEQAKAITTNDPRLIVLTEKKQELEKAERRMAAFDSEQYALRQRRQTARQDVKYYGERIEHTKKDIEVRKDIRGDNFEATVGKSTYDKRVDFGDALLARMEHLKSDDWAGKHPIIAEVAGFPVIASIRKLRGTKGEEAPQYEVDLAVRRSGNFERHVYPSNSALGLTRTLEGVALSLEDDLNEYKAKLAQQKKFLADSEKASTAEFTGGEEIEALRAEVRQLEAELAATAAATPKPIATDPGSISSLDQLTNLGLTNLAQPFEREFIAANAAPDIRSSAFKQWFGDSKVVDASGKPLVVFHGTDAGEFSEFAYTEDIGFHFGSRSVANARIGASPMAIRDTLREGGPFEHQEGRAVMPVYLKIENPLRLPDLNDWSPRNVVRELESRSIISQDRAATADIVDRETVRDWLAAKGYDGIVYRNSVEANGKGGDSYIVFHPEQIKSATGNRGTFDPSNPSILNRSEPRRAATLTPAAIAHENAIKGHLTGLIERLTGNVVRIEFRDRLPAVATGWGDTESSSSGGHYLPVEDVIRIALHDPAFADREASAFHESWHAIEDHFVSDKEMDLLKREEPRLRKIAQESRGYTAEEAAKLADYEVRAMAFETYAGDRANGGNGSGFHIGIRALFERLMRMFRQIGNFLRGLGFQTYEDVFEKAYQGKMKDRPSRKLDEGKPSRAVEAILAEQAKGELAQGMSRPHRRAGAPIGTVLADHIAAEVVADRLTQRNWDKLAGISQALGFGNINTTELRVKLQDKFLRWKKVEEAVERMTGAPVPEAMQGYTAESLYYGRTGERLERLNENHIDPLIDDIKRRGLTLEDVDTFLMARHAVERNAALRRINPHIADPSGMSDTEARGILNTIYHSPKRGDYGAIERRVRALIDETRRIMVAGGLIKQATADEWAAKYRYYVPLRGWADSETTDDALGVGHGFDIRGPETKKALGRRSRADSPLAYVMLQAQTAIVRSEKNRVGQAVLRFARANPDTSLWKVDYGNTTRKIDPSTGLVKDVSEPMWSMKDNVVAVKVDGVPHYINFQGEYGADLARALTQVGTANMHGVIRLLGAFTRFSARLATSLNPDFMLANMVRDAGEALINMQEQDQRRFVKQFAHHLPRALGGSFIALRGKTGGPYAQAFREFDAAGGRIRFFGLENVEDFKAETERRMRRLEGGVVNTVREAGAKVLEAIEIMNGAVENATRLAVFMAARDVGMSDHQAASLARDMTVNFNRKGELGAIISSLYMFSGAATQGMTRMLGALHNKRVRKAAYGLAAMGALMALYNLFAGGDDDDGVPYYIKLAPWERDTNIVLFWPKGMGMDGKYIKIPLPYGYAPFNVIGARSMTLATGKEKASKGVPAMVKSLLDAFDPLGRDENMIAQFTPTPFKPVVHIYSNENWTGRPLNPQKEPWNKHLPDSERSFRSASEFSQGAVKKLNEMTGGSKAEPGYVDIGAGTMDYMIGYVTGGLGRFLNNLGSTLYRGYQGQEWQVNKTPIVRRFVGEIDDAANRQLYFEARDEVQAAKQRADAYRKSGGEFKDQRERYLKEHRADILAADNFKAVDDRRRVIAKEIDRIKGMSLPPAEEEKRIKVQQKRELDFMAGARKRLDAARERQSQGDTPKPETSAPRMRINVGLRPEATSDAPP